MVDQGIEEVSCMYLMHMGSSRTGILQITTWSSLILLSILLCCFPILSCLRVNHQVKIYMYEAAEDDVHCFQEPKHIMEGTKAELNLHMINLHSNFAAAWRKLNNNYLGKGAKNTLAAEPENNI